MKNILEYFDTPYPDEVRRPYLIAEAGVNHEGSMETAKRLIREAAEGGADAIKFQSYKAKTLASVNSPAYWDTSKEKTASQYELFQKHDKFWKKEFEVLKTICDDSNIEFLSTPFDLESANFLDDLMPVYKISSSDITNKPFIEHIASYQKPILLSTGASNLSEIHEALEWLGRYDNPVCLMHCILNYPTKDENANLGMIQHLISQFPKNIIGYSDHTLPGNMDVLVYSYLLGAQILEKHFTHDKSLPGNDHYHAMNVDDIKVFVDRIDKVQSLMGSTSKYALESEQNSRKYARRSLVASKAIEKGEKFSLDNLTWKRPGQGISPKNIDEVIGCISTRTIQADEVLVWDAVKSKQV